jgi:DNA processing protein
MSSIYPMYTDIHFFILHLSLIDGIGPATIDYILKKVGTNSLSDVDQFSYAHWCHLGLPEKRAQLLVKGIADKALLEKTFLLIEKNNISWASFYDERYPVVLKNIHMPPPVIYWQGTLAVDSFNMAIIGSRKANDYARRVIAEIVPALINCGWTIVSGGAIGADSMAHVATLEEKGKTIAVLGSGLLKPYPSINKMLFKRIIELGGAVLSPFPLDTCAVAHNFPARNRVIAGLSRGCIVVQAAEKSGTRITAQYALEQGRDVFAVPGSVYDELSVGCHMLIQEGAKLITHPRDILTEYGQINTPKLNEEVKKSYSDNSEDEQAVVQDSLAKFIINACKKPCSVDELLMQTTLSLVDIQTKLFELQLEGVIAQDLTGMWVLSRVL